MGHEAIAIATQASEPHPLELLIRKRGHLKGWVAAQLGMDPSALSRVLSGRRELQLREALKAAELFGVDVRELVPGGQR